MTNISDSDLENVIGAGSVSIVNPVETPSSIPGQGPRSQSADSGSGSGGGSTDLFDVEETA